MKVVFDKLAQLELDDATEYYEVELLSTLEDWVLVDLKLGHPIPVIAGYDLNRESSHDSMAAL